MLADIVNRYLQVFPEEQHNLQLLLEQINNGDELNNRRNFRGHITGAGIILSPDKKKILLVNHKLFGRWQQPGGHWESSDEANPLQVARRESQEETCVVLGQTLSVADDPMIPLHIDTHEIAPNPKRDEPRHYHHDFHYCFVAQDTAISQRPEEVNIASIGWFDLDNPAADIVRRDIAKLKKFGFVGTSATCY